MEPDDEAAIEWPAGTPAGAPQFGSEVVAKTLRALGWGPIERPDDLAPAFAAAIEAVTNGRVAVVDVRVQPGYTPAMAAMATTPARSDRG